MAYIISNTSKVTDNSTTPPIIYTSNTVETTILTPDPIPTPLPPCFPKDWCFCEPCFYCENNYRCYYQLSSCCSKFKLTGNFIYYEN